LVFLSKLAEQAERYDEMVLCTKKLVQQNPELSVEDRNLLSVAFKNVIGTRRSSWRIVSSIEQKENQKGNQAHVTLIGTYRKRIEAELGNICQELLSLLGDKLIPHAQNGEAKVFFLKMKGDYHRYYAEVLQRVEQGDSQKQAALDAYTKAAEIAQSSLATTHPIRLGLALNFSVFHYEILKDTEKGCQLAKQAFDDAVSELEQLDDENYKESTLIMQLLRDNLTLWTEEPHEGDGTKVEEMDS